MINPSKIEMNFMTTDQFYIKCMNMGNKYFSMNKNKCNDIKIVYGKLILDQFKLFFSGALVRMSIQK